MVVMNDEELYKKALRFADKNYDRLTTDPAAMRKITTLAPNYRMTELQGAVALAQLDRLEWICAQRNTYGDALTAGIEGLPGILPHVVHPGNRSSYWFYMMRIDEKELGASREQFCEALAAEGVSNSLGYIPTCVYEYDLFQNQNAYPGTDCPWGCKYYGRGIEYKKGLCPIAEEILSTAVRLNVNEFFTKQDLDETVAAVRKVAQHFRAQRAK
jgi:dTDP-4-amino-4,6-dideoxygalactose transaminase